MESAGLLVSDAAPGEGRLKPLRPTDRKLRILTGRAEAGFAEFAATVHKAEQRLADTQSGVGA
jgi:hypothetical protein